MTDINFNVTREENGLIMQIIARYERLVAKHQDRSGDRVKPDRMTLVMDMCACHANGTPLKLAELLKADDFNLMHDVGGIRRHMDRETGKLTGCFLPRYAAPQRDAEAA